MVPGHLDAGWEYLLKRLGELPGNNAPSLTDADLSKRTFPDPHFIHVAE